MTPTSSSYSDSSVPIDLNYIEDQNHDHELMMFSPNPQASSSATIFFNPVQDQRGSVYYRELKQLQQSDHDEGEKLIPCGGSWDDHTVIAKNNESNNGLKLKVSKKEDRIIENQTGNNNGSVKWMSSIMKKMMVSDHDHQKKTLSPSNSSNNSSTIRVCADCNTTKTPLWRSGPRGPKSLCNACGIRQRKARRAMAAATAAANGTILSVETAGVKGKDLAHKKVKKSSNNVGSVAQFKKRCKLGITEPSSKKLCFEDFTVSLSNNLALQKVFPQDEKEAAILLMALSYGLVHG